MPNVRVTGVCDAEPLMAQQLASRYGVPRYYGRADQLFEQERPNVAHITAPPHSHLELTTLALDAGCHVLVEKPIGRSHAEAEALVQHAVLRQRNLTVGYGFYFEPICLEMRRLVADGVLGDPVHVESFMGYQVDGQFGSPVFADSEHWVHGLPGKLVHNVLDHVLNKVTEFVLDERPSVLAHASQRGASAFAVVDELRVMIAGRDVTGYATFSAHARPVAHTLTVYGTRNTLALDFVAGTLTRRSTSSLPGSLGRLQGAFDQSWQQLRVGGANVVRFARSQLHYLTGLRNLISVFHESVRLGAPPPIPYSEILRVSALIEEIIAQMGERARGSS
jgi:predicted dehydrogenase